MSMLCCALLCVPTSFAIIGSWWVICLIVFLMCAAYWSVALPRSAIHWSAVCDCFAYTWFDSLRPFTNFQLCRDGSSWVEQARNNVSCSRTQRSNAGYCDISRSYSLAFFIGSAVAQWSSAWLETKGPRVRASPASLHCGPWARHIYPSLVLVQPRKTRPYITERLLIGRK